MCFKVRVFSIQIIKDLRRNWRSKLFLSLTDKFTFILLAQTVNIILGTINIIQLFKYGQLFQQSQGDKNIFK